MGQTCKVCRAWEAYADVGQFPRSDWTPPRGSERFYSREMFMIESRSEKKEDGLRSPLTEARRGAEPEREGAGAGAQAGAGAGARAQAGEREGAGAGAQAGGGAGTRAQAVVALDGGEVALAARMSSLPVRPSRFSSGMGLASPSA